MRDEGYVSIDTTRFGLASRLRRKQWWSFEGLDVQRKLYFVFLALQAFPTDYISLKVIDYAHNRRWTEDHLGSFQAAPGDRVEVSAAGKWGRLSFSGQAETGWQIDVETAHVVAHCRQEPQAPAHCNRLLTQHIDYIIHQFILNRAAGSLGLDGAPEPFAGYGYCEHNWGVQPRHSTAHWLHFWAPDLAGVALSCSYDAGTPHHYTLLWHAGGEHTLHSPAEFTFDPAHPDQPCLVRSPDLELSLHPLAGYHTRMKLPPVLPYIDIDYHEQLLEVRGTAWVRGEAIPIEGAGKLDHNWNRW